MLLPQNHSRVAILCHCERWNNFVSKTLSCHYCICWLLIWLLFGWKFAGLACCFYWSELIYPLSFDSWDLLKEDHFSYSPGLTKVGHDSFIKTTQIKLSKNLSTVGTGSSPSSWYIEVHNLKKLGLKPCSILSSVWNLNFGGWAFLSLVQTTKSSYLFQIRAGVIMVASPPLSKWPFYS